MSSQRKRHIIEQAESQGWTIDFIEWEPIGIAMEKSGPSGGWSVELSRDGKGEWAGGYNAAQVIQWIKNLDLPFGEQQDPFACCGKYHSFGPDDCLRGRGHKGECETKRTRGLAGDAAGSALGDSAGEDTGRSRLALLCSFMCFVAGFVAERKPR